MAVLTKSLTYVKSKILQNALQACLTPLPWTQDQPKTFSECIEVGNYEAALKMASVTFDQCMTKDIVLSLAVFEEFHILSQLSMSSVSGE